MSGGYLKFGDPIPLTEAQSEALGKQLVELTEEAESQHAGYFADIAIWHEWYEAKPFSKTKSVPWPGASNIVVPFIRSQADPLAARATLSIFSSAKLWWGTTESMYWKDRIPHVFGYLNLTANRGFSTFDSWDPACLEMYVIGEAVVGQRWAEHRKSFVLGKDRKPKTVVTRVGPEFYHRPREEWLWNRAKQVHQSEYVIEQCPMTWTDLVCQTAGPNGWDKPAVDAIKTQPGLMGPGQTARRARLAAQGVPDESYAHVSNLYDIRQATIDWPLFTSLDKGKELKRPTHIFDTPVEEDVHVQVVVHFHRISGKILRAIYDPNILPEKPFYGIQYRRRTSAAGGSVGIAKIGEHIQRGLSTHINQGFDAVTMGNSMKYITSNKELANRVWSPNTIPFVQDLTQFQELSGQKNILPDIQALNALQAIGERAIGQADPNLGREVRLGGHPQPATNFLGITEQSQMNNSRPMKNIRMALSRAGQDRAMMAQLYENNEGDWLQAAFDADDAGHIMEFLESDEPIYGNLNFDVHALSEIHNPDAERQQAILIDQVTTNYFITVSRFVEMMANPQVAPPVKEVLRQAVLAKTTTLKRFLESSDVDDIESYVLQLGQARAANEDLLSSVAQRLGVGPGGPGGAPGAVPGAAPVPGGPPAPPGGPEGAGGPVPLLPGEGGPVG